MVGFIGHCSLVHLGACTTSAVLRFPIASLPQHPTRFKPCLDGRASSLIMNTRLEISAYYLFQRTSPRDFVCVLSCGILRQIFTHDPTMSNVHPGFLILTILLIGITTRSASGFSSTKFVECYPKFEADLQFRGQQGNVGSFTMTSFSMVRANVVTYSAVSWRTPLSYGRLLSQVPRSF